MKFIVVQFVELPFEGIDDYECVPPSWIYARSTNQRVSVAYPNNEHPWDTRERVERRESPNSNWKRYMAIEKYESDKYQDAEFWIATRNDYAPIIEEERSNTRGTQSALFGAGLHRESINLPHNNSCLLTKVDKPQLAVKPYKNLTPMAKIMNKRRIQSEPQGNLYIKRSRLN